MADLPAPRRTLGGLEYFRRMLAGEVPRSPLVALFGFRLVEVDAGRAVFVARPGEAFFNGLGIVHGGYAAALLDTAMGCAVNSTMAPGRAFATLDLKVTFTRPLRGDGGGCGASHTRPTSGAVWPPPRGASSTPMAGCTRRARPRVSSRPNPVRPPERP